MAEFTGLRIPEPVLVQLHPMLVIMQQLMACLGIESQPLQQLLIEVVHMAGGDRPERRPRPTRQPHPLHRPAAQRQLQHRGQRCRHFQSAGGNTHHGGVLVVMHLGRQQLGQQRTGMAPIPPQPAAILPNPIAWLSTARLSTARLSTLRIATVLSWRVLLSRALIHHLLAPADPQPGEPLQLGTAALPISGGAAPRTSQPIVSA